MAHRTQELEAVLDKLRLIRCFRRDGRDKPHKFLFLLALARLYEADPGRDNLFPIDDSLLVEAFSTAVKEFFSSSSVGSFLIEYPFSHLRSDNLWELLVLEGKEEAFNRYDNSPVMRLTRQRLMETARGGKVEESLDKCLRDAVGNEEIQSFLYERLSEMSEPIEALTADVAYEEPAPYSLFAHEEDAIGAIKSHVDAHRLGKTLSNLELHDALSNRYFETDLVIISRFGVYVVELKHWSGRIEIGPNSWLQNGSFYKDDPHKANNFKAKLLRGLYERKFPSFPSVYFESVVVLTNPETDVVGGIIPTTELHNPTFDSIDRFLQYLKSQRASKPQSLSDNQCDMFAKYVQRLHRAGPPRDFVFPGYEIVERLYQYDDRAEVIARRTDFRYRRLSRLRIFFISPGDPRAQEKATATLNAVEKIGDHPNILKVWDIPNENNYLVEGSDWSETGTLRDHLASGEKHSLEKSLDIAAGLARGLQAAHSEYVVHRFLLPKNVLLVNETPKLMNFDLSFQLEDNRVTVIPDASSLKRSAYVAPEIYIEGTVPEATADLFSLGVILYEMISGKPPFGCSTDLERSDGRLSDEQVRVLRNIEGVTEPLIGLIDALIRQNPRDRIADAGKVLALLENCRKEPMPQLLGESNPRLGAGAASGLYRIKSFVATGAESQIYRAAGPRDKHIALKVFNRDVPLQRIISEQGFAATVHHPSLVKVDSYSQWADERYFIAYAWISEKTLRDKIESGARPEPEAFIRGAGQLLDALKSMHSAHGENASGPILHNDIKPENIMLDQGGRLILIDFGAASHPHVDTYEGTEGYVAPDLRLGKDRKYCVGGDLYALAVTLHEWLLGCRPGTEAADHDEALGPLVEWLQNGCADNAGDRFGSADEMVAALLVAAKVFDADVPEKTVAVTRSDAHVIGTGEPAKPARIRVIRTEGSAVPNPFVPYLNTLHSCNAANENALAESQARNPFFGFIHVVHPVADTIHDILVANEKKHVVLTGHAGDGKSTIAVDIFKRLSGLPPDQALSRSLAPREDVGKVSLIKDFSEWSLTERAELMQEMLDPDGPRFLLVSNTGTLLDAFKDQEMRRGGDWVAIESDLLTFMNEVEPATLEFQKSRFVIVNVAMMDNLEIGRQIFDRMLTPERWAPCQTADCRSECPIFRNISLIRANLPLAQDRLFLAYRRMYEYGTRLTLRQLCAHMAYILTSGLEHSDVVKMAERPVAPMMAEFMFFNRFFGENGAALDPQALQLRGVHAVRRQGFGAQPCPTWERHLWLRSRGQSFQLKAEKGPDDFETLRRIGAGLLIDDEISAADARDQVRRAVFFLHKFEDEGSPFLRTFLRSNMLPEFMQWQDPENGGLGHLEALSLRRRILHVLQEHFTSVRLPEGTPSEQHLFVTLSRRSSDVRQSAQVVLASFPTDNFDIALRKHANPAGGMRRDLVLKGPAETLVLELPLPFLDYVMLRNRGEIGKALEASYIDRLERFKGQLIAHAPHDNKDKIMLVRLRTNHTFRRQFFAVRNQRLEVNDAN